MKILPINEEYRPIVNDILKREWNCPPSISKGKATDTTIIPGFVAVDNDEVTGVVTYNIVDSECEIVTLNSLIENKGIGTALINEVLAAAKSAKCTRLWLITTNDDINAIRFYQLKGFDLAAAHINAMDNSRKLKPSIPLIGMDNIPLKHELEFEIVL
jgi:Acetyltransferases